MKNDNDPLHRFADAWDSLSETDKFLLSHTAITSSYFAAPGQTLVSNRTARIVFTLAAVIVLCLVFYMAPSSPREAVAAGVILTIAFTLIAVFAWLHHPDHNK